MIQLGEIMREKKKLLLDKIFKFDHRFDIFQIVNDDQAREQSISSAENFSFINGEVKNVFFFLKKMSKRSNL